jgi:hypothetical protein
MYIPNLALSLVTTMAAAVLFQPLLMEPPRRQEIVGVGELSKGLSFGLAAYMGYEHVRFKTQHR